ncbi:MAG: type II-A CRISPR-associated protein Csn2 [Eubacteriales bacterium]
MIRLAWSLLGEPVDLSTAYARVFVLEGPTGLRRFHEALEKEQQKEESGLFLSKDYDALPFVKSVMVVEQVMSVNPNQKKVLSKLYENLEKTAMDEDFYLLTGEIQASLLQYVDKLLSSSPLALTVGELELSSLLKSMDVQIDVKNISLLERICYFMDVVCDVLKQEIFLFFHLKSYLEEEELAHLYQHCRYRNYILLLVESQSKPKLAHEEITIIDKDLCRIT